MVLSIAVGQAVQHILHLMVGEAHPRQRLHRSSVSGKADLHVGVPLHPPRVLLEVVEDDPAVQRVLRRVLESHEHRVICASHGVDALERIKERGEGVDLVITDVVMPELGGVELVEKLRSIWPGLPVVFMSGYTADSFEDSPLDDPTFFLTKPFSHNELLDLVWDVSQKGFDPALRVPTS